jgi:hypothetical protein
MLGYIILILLQIAGAWFITPKLRGIVPSIPPFGGYNVEIFVWALLVAVIVFLIGFVGSILLKGVRTPGVGTLTLAIFLALIFAALTFVTPVTQAVGQFVPALQTQWWPIVGAVLGYLIRR